MAIILVMLFHFYFVLEVGWVGVQLFFVLSGYLITSILLKEKVNPLKAYLGRFYWRRSLRIFPLYFIYIIIVHVGYLLVSKPENFGSLAPYLYTYTFNYQPLVQGYQPDIAFTHFWSLSVEEQFYLFWPFLIFFLNGRALKILVISLILLCPIFRFWIVDLLTVRGVHEIGEIVYRLTPSQLDAFAIGAAIPVFSLQNISSRVSNKILALASVLFAGGAAISFASISGLSWTSIGYPIGGLIAFQHIWSYTCIDLMSGALILTMVVKRERESWGFSFLKKIFETPFMVFIGKISYGLYVYHWIILSIYRSYVHPLVQNLFIGFILYSIAVIAVSYASFQIIEKFFLKLKDGDISSFRLQKKIS